MSGCAFFQPFVGLSRIQRPGRSDRSPRRIGAHGGSHTQKGLETFRPHYTAISELDLTIRDGEFFVLLGPTGAGKTTTLRLIAGLEKPEEGTIIIAGQDATKDAPAQRDVAFVFQQYSLYPHLSVYENLAFPLRAPSRKTPAAEIAQRVERVAKMVRIDHKLQNRSTRLSGGEMQRVAIGRALIREPNIYLMDEPLSSLDAKLRVDLRLEIKRIQRDMGATILRDPRRSRSDDAGRSHRHPARRRSRPTRQPARDL